MSSSNKYNRLSTDVSHRYGRANLKYKINLDKQIDFVNYGYDCLIANLVIDGIKLGEDDAINGVRVLVGGMISKSSVELHELVNSLVTNQGLPNKQNKVRSID